MHPMIHIQNALSLPLSLPAPVLVALPLSFPASLPAKLASSLARHRARRVAVLGCAVGSMIEPLEGRRLYAVTATAAGGVLTVSGDANANVITVSRNAAGNLLVNNGAVAITGAAATVANTNVIKILGGDGNDTLAIDETAGALPKASLSGGGGNDTLSGGAGADTLSGDGANDSLLGLGGNDQLFGGSGNDRLIGGTGTDQAFGQSGNDRMIWNPGDGSDLNEGGEGTDTVEVIGGGVGESFTAEAVGARVLFTRTAPAPFTIDIGTSEKLLLNAGGGDDSFSGGTGLATLMSFTVNGGDGNDTIIGTDGADRLTGGNGNDFIDGNKGADLALMGNGHDVFRWDPGDGSDTVEGQGGSDSMVFNGTPTKENIDISDTATGRLRFFRDLGNITMDVNDTESVQFNAIGGGDNIVVHNLAGTDVRNVGLNLERAADDPEAATVLVEGSNGDDVVSVSSGSAASGVSVRSLFATVIITGSEPADTLNIKALGGNDIVNAVGLGASAIRLAVDGGDGNDLIIGSAGNDTLLGGDGDDVLVGAAGNDQLNGGGGHNIVLQ